MKLFITGAAGFIGSNFARHVLATSDDSVVVYDALTYAGNLANLADLQGDSRFTFVEACVLDPIDVEGEFELLACHRATPIGPVLRAAWAHPSRRISKMRRTSSMGATSFFMAASSRRTPAYS